GRDTISGGDGVDVIFGGGGSDSISGGADDDYIDAGSGSDLDVSGGGGNDVIRGGDGNDVLRGDDGIDHLLGDDGDDQIYGDKGTANGSQAGQRLFGGAGRDQLFGYAETNDGATVIGDQLFGESGGDFLRGNIRRELLVGGEGNDFIHGDFLNGPQYNENSDAEFDGGDDTILGGGGNDQLFGGGGNDAIWGGLGSDKINGQGGSDRQYGGGGIDFFVMPISTQENDVLDGHFENEPGDTTADDNATDVLSIIGTSDDDTILIGQRNGEVGILFNSQFLAANVLNENQDPVIDQFRISGLGGNDTIGFITESALRAGLDLSNINLDPLDLTKLGETRDIVGAFMGNSGDDVLIGADGRDELNGGRGSDLLYGFGGDDRLLGDEGEGSTNDRDAIFAGQGNDDVEGGQGRNELYAWSIDPDPRLTQLFLASGQTAKADSAGTTTLKASQPAPANGRLRGDAQFGLSVDGGEFVQIAIPASVTAFNFDANTLATQIAAAIDSTSLTGISVALDSRDRITISAVAQTLALDVATSFGVFVDDQNALYSDDGNGLRVHEVTGLNRILGSERNDRLYGGTTLDFMYGNGGDDVLFRSDGTTLESLDGGQAGNAWKEYARESDQVWYVGGTNARDEISVNYVTEPGLLGDHHLITRLTENNGNFSFDAQVRLDFTATNSDGSKVWDGKRALDLDQLFAASDEKQTEAALEELAAQRAESISRLLPPEGDFLAIIVDALAGNDEITVGPTVQKTVWVDAGAGDDVVDIRAGHAILVDKAEQLAGVSKRNDTPVRAFRLSSEISVANDQDQTEETPNDRTLLMSESTSFEQLSIDNPEDVDWFVFTLAEKHPAGKIELASGSPVDSLTVKLFDAFPANATPLVTGTQAVDMAKIASGEYEVEFEIQVGDAANTISITNVALANLSDFVQHINVAIGANATLTGKLLAKPDGDRLLFEAVDATHHGLLMVVDVNEQNVTGFQEQQVAVPPSPLSTENLTERAISTPVEQDGKRSEVSISALFRRGTYLIQVNSPNLVPTVYDLRFNLEGTSDPNVLGEFKSVDFSLRTDNERRDVILGGEGNDILRGGAGEDWVFGGAGNDVLTGGSDRGARDLLFGGSGDDTFQIIPDALPLLTNQPDTNFDPGTSTYIPTFSDQLRGGSGNDRVLFLGGDKDRNGYDVPDFASLRYNTLLHRYEFSSLVWDIGRQEFMTTFVDEDGDKEKDANEKTIFEQRYYFYQTRDIESTEFNLRAGDDVVRLDAEFKFLPDEANLTEADAKRFAAWGINQGDFEQGARDAAAKILGGSGDDILFGGPLSDTINGGPGDDILVGGLGNDQLLGEGGADRIYGASLDSDAVAQLYPHKPAPPINFEVSESEEYVYDLAAPFLELTNPGRPGVNRLDVSQIPPLLYYSFDDSANLGRDGTGGGNHAVPVMVEFSASGARGGSASFTDQASALRIGDTPFDGFPAGDTWTASAWFKDIIDTTDDNILFSGFPDEVETQIEISRNGNHLGSDLQNDGGFKDSLVVVTPAEYEDAWHQMTATFAAGKFDYYIDGRRVGQAVGESGSIFKVIGNWKADGIATERFAKQIDEVYIFGQAFNETQVRQHYESSLQPDLNLESQAFGLEGVAVDEHLSDLQPIGDFNDDGRDDFIVSSETASYVLFGPLELDTMERVDEYAEIVIDHASLGRPATSFGDIGPAVTRDGVITNDGLGDLVFVRDDDGDIVVTVVFGNAEQKDSEPWTRDWNESFIRNGLTAKNSRVIRLSNTTFSPLGTVNVHVLEATGDDFADVIVIADSTTGATSIEPDMFDLGYAFAGSVIAPESAGFGELTLQNKLASFRSSQDFRSIPSAVAGDVNGDGIEELLFGNTDISIQVDAVTTAVARAANIPNSSFVGLAPLNIAMGPFSTSIEVAFDDKSLRTADELAVQINEKLATTVLAGKVTASHFGTGANKLLQIESIEGGRNIRLTINEPGTNQHLGIGQGQPGGLTSFVSTQDLEIDSGAPATYTASQTVDAPGVIADLDIKLNIAHTYHADLVVTLVHPDGTRVKLFDRIGGSTDNFTNTTLNDEAVTPIANGNGTFNGSFVPQQPLSQLDGKPLAGTWQLEIVDVANLDGGELKDWTLLITPSTGVKASGTEIAIPGLSFAAPILSQLSEDNSLRVTLDSPHTNPSQPLRLGDLNNDGYDDFAFSNTADLEIFYGAEITSSIFNTQSVADIRSGSDSSAPRDPVVFNGWLYFQANDGVHGSELWRYDGNKIELAADIYPGPESGRPSNLVVFKDAIYFRARDAEHGSELWRFDGNDSALVFDINNGPNDSTPLGLTPFGDSLFFGANDGVNGNELWKTDGVETRLVENIDNSATDSLISNQFIEFEDSLYFSARGPDNGFELWRYTGTVTEMADDINPGIDNSLPREFAVFNDALYFSANNGTGGSELWRFDGSDSELVSEIRTGPAGSTPSGQIVFNDALYFSAEDGVHGAELWRFNGTDSELVSDIQTGPAGSTPSGQIVFNDALYFSANDGVHGWELWRYDGNSSEMVEDIRPGPDGSSAFRFAEFNGALYFAADDGLNGIELRRFAPITISGTGLTASSGDFNADGAVDLAVVQLDSEVPATYIFDSFSDTVSQPKTELSAANAYVPLSGVSPSGNGWIESDGSGFLAQLSQPLWIESETHTTEAWVRVPQVGSGGLEAGESVGNVFQFSDDSSASASWHISSSGLLYFSWTDGSDATSVSAFGSTDLRDNQWHHLAIVRNATSNRVIGYVDGNPEFSVNNSGPDLDFSSDSFRGIIGSVFHGAIDDVRVWNRALSADEIASAAVGSVATNDPSLRTWFQFNEFSGRNFVDNIGTQPDALQPLASPLVRRVFSESRSHSNVDLNNDGLDDLILSAGFAQSDVGAEGGGRLYFIAGARKPVDLPEDFDVLENVSFPGGGFVTDRGTGQPTLFDDGGEPFGIPSGETERWFQFSTLGDGKGGDAVRLTANAIADLYDANGGVLATSQSAFDLRVMEAGTYYLRVFVPVSSISLGNLFDDAANVAIADALASDTFKVTADSEDLAVDHVTVGGVATLSLNAAGN
ncbi:MAG: ELWxxDGT repeat protein, partial [Pirellulaceae bacterium]